MISFAQSALTVAEGGSLEVCVNASNPDPDGQAFVEVALAADAAPHLGGFTTQTLSFSGGAQTLQSCFTLQTAQPTGGEDDNYTYTLTLQNPSGGFNAGLGSPSTLTLTVLEANPGCPWAGEDRTICMGESVQIGCPRVGPTDPGANYCYKWLPEEGLEQPYNAITTATVDETTIYTVYISDNHGNLVATDEMTVFVEAKLSVTPVFPLICPGDTVILEATVEGSAENVFSWSTGETTSSITVTPHQTSFYTVEATSIDLGCTMRYRARVNVKYPPFIHISATSPAICHLALPALRGNQPIEEEKDNEYSCEYSSTWLYAGTGFPGYTYEWSTGETTPDIDVTVPGEYSVTVTKIGGCTTIDTVEIFPCYEVEIKPHVITSDLGDQYFLDAGEGYVSYIWHDGSTDRYIPVSSNVVYSVTVVDNNGCMGEGTLAIAPAIGYSSETYLVLWTRYEDQRNVFIWNPNGEPAVDKDKIEMAIGKWLPENDKATNYFWTSNPTHSDNFPIDRNMGSSNIRLYPIVLINTGDQLYVTGQYYHGNPQALVSYKFKLTIGGVEYYTDQSTSFFLINYPTLSSSISAELYQENAPPGSNDYVPVITNYQITFKENIIANHDYVLFYQGQEAPDEIQVQEFSNVSFEVKIRQQDGSFTDLDPASVQKIRWRKNNMPENQFGYYNNKVTLYIPIFDNLNSLFTFGFEIDEMNSGGIKTDQASIHILPKPITPGIFITNSSNVSGEFVCVNVASDTLFMNYVQAAKKKIQDKDAEMLNAIISGNNRQIDIVLTTATDSHFPQNLQQGQVFYGVSDYHPIDPSGRIMIDKEKMVYSQQSGYSDCPINTFTGKMLVQLSDSEVDIIIEAINDNMPNIPENVQNILIKIVAVYPDIATIVSQLCSVSIAGGSQTIQNKINEAINSFYDILNIQKKCAYYATETELEELIQIPNYGAIYLAAGNLCYVPNYSELRDNRTGYHSETLTISSWYNNTFNPPSDSDVDELRKKQITRTLAHEMGHIHHVITNKIEAYKWELIKALFDFDNNNCRPGLSSNPTTAYCSLGSGHEIDNPDGQHACAIENSGKYPKPIVVID